MTYTPTKEDVERAARIMAVAAFAPEETWAQYADAATNILRAHHLALAERGVFVAAWWPIETAPKDGTVVWVYVAARKNGVPEELPAFQCACAYHPDAGWCADELREVTHWMPTEDDLLIAMASALATKCGSLTYLNMDTQEREYWKGLAIAALSAFIQKWMESRS